VSPYRRPDHVAVARATDADTDTELLYLALLPDGPVIELNGTSALIWQAAVSSAEDVAATVADEVGVGRSTVVGDVDRFLGQLAELGFIEPV